MEKSFWPEDGKGNADCEKMKPGTSNDSGQRGGVTS